VISPLTWLFTNPIAFVAFVVTLAIAFTLHEFSHAAAAVAQGDQTPRAQGRLSLNPIRHIEPVGALFILLAGIGWARPVEFMPSRLRFGRVGAVLVALVGPISNFVLALVAAVLIRVGAETGWLYTGSWDLFLAVFFQLNVVLGVFNLLPIPPLDGSRLLSLVLPPSQQGILRFLEQYGIFILLAILLIPAVSGFSLLGPLFEAVERFIAGLVGIEGILVI
jgi:Zn-dependent protease